MSTTWHNVIHRGDCREIMAGMEADSIDAIVCDPPYELGFMGRSWDRSGIANDVDMWREAYRVLKPGAHLVAFSGSRTYHRLACAIEDAGFEIRDQLQWLYGSGFPKSLDVSKAMDKRRDDDVRPVCRFLRDAMDHASMNARAIAEHFGFHSRMVDHWAARDTDSQPSVPTWEQWLALKDLLGFGDEMNAEVWRLNGRKGQPGEAWHEREVLGQTTKARSTAGGSALPTLGAAVEYRTWDDTSPATDLARQWDGWGTALKPAHEPIVLARKPLIGTVAANVTAHGTGALNIDATRIPSGQDHADKCASVVGLQSNRNGNAYGEWTGTRTDSHSSLGRWPANVILDEDAGALLDEMTGERKSTDRAKYAGRVYANGGATGGFTPGHQGRGYSDTGGASRFFYCAKASRAERNAGLEGMPEKPLLWSAGTQNPGSFQSEGTHKAAQNSHPTVKPISLMRWLCRLIAPPGGTILDPFTGSGTTGIAAVLEGFRFIGCEMDPAYVAIAERRIAHWAHEARKVANPNDFGPLFALAAD